MLRLRCLDTVWKGALQQVQRLYWWLSPSLQVDW